MEGKKVTVVARFKAKAGLEEKVKEGLLGMVKPTRAEAGCINYDLHQAFDDKTVFVFYENWKSKEDLDEHLKTAHFQAFLVRANELLAEPTEIILMDMIS